MKKSYKLLMSILFVTLFSCESDSGKNSQLLNELSQNQIEVARWSFYNSNTNVISPKNTTVKFSVIPLNSSEIQYVSTDIVEKTFLKKDLDAGLIKAIATYHYDNGSEKIEDEDIFAFSVYDVKSKNQIVHRFFLKEGDEFILKKELKETFINTESQNFLIWKYKNEDYSIGNIKVSRLFNMDDNSIAERRRNTRNEFKLFVLRHKYPNADLLQKNEDFAYEEVGLENCLSGCAETGNGTCDGGWYCDTGGFWSESESSQEQSYSQSLISQTEAETLFDLNLDRRLRDEFLKSSSLGQKHVDYYYAISEFVLTSDYEISTFVKMISVLPSVNQAINSLLDGDNIDDILITSQMNSEITSIINDYKAMSDNPDFNYILDDLKSDIDIMTNLDKGELILAFE